MFGLMKVSTHEAEVSFLEKIRQSQGAMINKLAAERDTAKTRASTAEAEVVMLKGQLKNTTDDRDAWKQSESACNTQYNKLQAVNVALKARIAELEKPVPLPKRKPVVKASPVKETVKVPVKGKVK